MQKVEEMICQDILSELTELDYLSAGDGYFYRKVNDKPLALFLLSKTEMTEKIKRLFVVYNRTLKSDSLPRGISLTSQMIRCILKNLPVYKIELIKQEGGNDG